MAFSGVASSLFIDVGVAGLWRLMGRIDAISKFPIVIAVAGMDAALPTVLGGLIPGLIIAVPTSVGYGVAAGGRTALNALLASCASGIAVVNIDNGYGAACAALRALRMSRQRGDRMGRGTADTRIAADTGTAADAGVATGAGIATEARIANEAGIAADGGTAADAGISADAAAGC